MKPVMALLAGPDGAGQSTLYETRVAPSLKAPFINAALIRRQALGDPTPEAAYRSARIADARRADHMARGASFATETVFSHPSKRALVEEATARGFDVILFHVSVAAPDLSVARVAERVKEGGHPVPEAKIRERHDRNGPLIRAAMLLARRGFVFDNSALNQPPALLMRFADGRLTSAAPQIPDWARAIYAAELGG